jgi:predicted TPR repeat methyltransferase
LDEDLAQRSGCGCGNLRVDLVGRDLEQRLVGVDVVADALEPARDRALGDGLAELRHLDVHRGPSVVRRAGFGR